MDCFKKIIFFLICGLILFTPFTYAEEDKKVVLIVMNEVNYDDLYLIPSVRRLIEDGSIGLMNNRTSSKANTYKAYTTIGAGTRAEASSDSTNFSIIDPETQSIYLRRTGSLIPEHGIINKDIVRLRRQNELGEYGAVPGALGQALHEMGLKTAVLGNSDTDSITIRLGAAIAMDQQGYIDGGDISRNILLQDDAYPFGLKSNYSKMIESFRNLYTNNHLIVLELGDIGRLERYKENLSDEQYLNQKKIILGDADQYIADVLNTVDFQKTRVMLVTPYPSSKDIGSGRKLTPIIVYGAGISKGLIYSDTTHREGIIGNIDIAPFILQFFDTESQYMQGKKLHFIDTVDNYTLLKNLETQVVHTSNNRLPVLSTFAIFEILVSISALMLLLFKEKFNLFVVGFFKTILLSTMIVPFVLLIVPLFHSYNLLVTYLLIIACTGLLTFCVQRFCKEIDAVIFLSGITTFTILLDLITNGNLMKMSLLGYDPIIGARYYGIGNEYMGVLIGSTLVFAAALLDRFRISKKIILFVFLTTIVIIGFPKLGANVGGTITAVSAFTFTALRLFKIKIKIKQIFMIGLLVISVVLIMAVIDLKLINGQSHLAGAVGQIIEDGPAVILLILKRKISMNIRLIGVTIWSKVLISTIIILAVLFYRPVKMVYRLNKLYPNLSIGWSGIVAACIVGFAVNDSGIVAAATGIIFLAMSMLYLSFFVPKHTE